MTNANAASWVWYIECDSIVDSVIKKRFDEVLEVCLVTSECEDGTPRYLWMFLDVALLDVMINDFALIQKRYKFFYDDGDGIIKQFEDVIPYPCVPDRLKEAS